MLAILLIVLMLWVANALRLLPYARIARRAATPTMMYNATAHQGYLKGHLERCWQNEVQNDTDCASS